MPASQNSLHESLNWAIAQLDAGRRFIQISDDLIKDIAVPLNPFLPVDKMSGPELEKHFLDRLIPTTASKLSPYQDEICARLRNEEEIEAIANLISGKSGIALRDAGNYVLYCQAMMITAIEGLRKGLIGRYSDDPRGMLQKFVFEGKQTEGSRDDLPSSLSAWSDDIIDFIGNKCMLGVC